MNEPEVSNTPYIIAEIYEARRLFQWHWRFRFIGSNGEIIGHEYNDSDSARDGLNLIVKPKAEVHLRVRHRDGSVVKIGRIR